MFFSLHISSNFAENIIEFRNSISCELSLNDRRLAITNWKLSNCLLSIERSIFMLTTAYLSLSILFIQWNLLSPLHSTVLIFAFNFRIRENNFQLISYRIVMDVSVSNLCHFAYCHLAWFQLYQLPIFACVCVYIPSKWPARTEIKSIAISCKILNQIFAPKNNFYFRIFLKRLHGTTAIRFWYTFTNYRWRVKFIIK